MPIIVSLHFRLRVTDVLVALICHLLIFWILPTSLGGNFRTSALKRLSCDSVRFIHCVFNLSLIYPLRPLFLVLTMPTSFTIIEQDEIPGEPSSAVVREYSLETLSEMRTDFLHDALSEGAPGVIGVSLGLTSGGPHIRTLALATPDNVFDLAIRRPPSQAHKRILRTLFSKIPYLVGFELPYTIVLLAHTLGGAISGHDLSSVNLMPGTLIESIVPSASAARINERWESDVPCSDTEFADTPEPNHCVRAWFTAMYASVFYLHL